MKGRIRLLLLLAGFTLTFFSCKNHVATGGISLTIVIPSFQKGFYPAAVSSTLLEKGKIEVTVSRKNWVIHRTFKYLDYSGVITGIPAGKGYTVKVIAQFVTLFYSGVVSDITVLPGIVTDAGTLYLRRIPSSFTHQREKPPVPVVLFPTTYQAAMTRDITVTIYGLKATGTAIVVNEYERIHPNDETHWSVTVQLSKNQWNHFKIVARRYFEDQTSLDSDPVYVSILHDWISPSSSTVNFAFGGSRAVFMVTPGSDPASGVDGSRSGVIGVAVFRGAQCPVPEGGVHYKKGANYDGAVFLGYYGTYVTDMSVEPGVNYRYCFYTVDGAYNYSEVYEKDLTTADKINLSRSGKVITSDDYFFVYKNGVARKYFLNGSAGVEYNNIRDIAVAPGAYALLLTSSISVHKDDDTSLYQLPVTSRVYGISITGETVPYMVYATCTSIQVVDENGSVLKTLSGSGTCFVDPYMNSEYVAYVDIADGKIKIWNFETNQIFTPEIGYTGSPVTGPVLVETVDGFYLGFVGNGVVGYAHINNSFSLLGWRIFPGNHFDLDSSHFYFSDGSTLLVTPFQSDFYPLVFAEGEWFDVSVTQQRLLWIGSGYVCYR